MFLIVRTIDGKTEILKDSYSHLSKTFPSSIAAEDFCIKLNHSTIPEKHWRVERSEYS